MPDFLRVENKNLCLKIHTLLCQESQNQYFVFSHLNVSFMLNLNMAMKMWISRFDFKNMALVSLLLLSGQDKIISWMFSYFPLVPPSIYFKISSSFWSSGWAVPRKATPLFEKYVLKSDLSSSHDVGVTWRDGYMM